MSAAGTAAPTSAIEHGSPAATRQAEFSYVLPLRMARDDGSRSELADYLARLSVWCDDVIVVDGSPAAVFNENREAWTRWARHVPPDPRYRAKMGKVPGVLTGVALAAHEAVVIADDDVRYELGELTRLVGLLGSHDLVRPQNYFAPMPWHAVWDTSRTLLNRAVGADFPGTLGVRRSTFAAMGGYDGDVLFENLELIRTVRAHGGRVASPLDLYVRRIPPATSHFIGQRTRQAYDDFAIPARMAAWLAVMPLLLACVARRRAMPPAILAAAIVALAERGRRRAGGDRVFPPAATATAPIWVLERGICAWLALAQRIRFGGVRYGDSVIRVAANSPRTLRRRARAAGRARLDRSP
jgi:hypothetical protein